MGNIGCCLWWLVFGLLAGFVLAWLLGAGARRSGPSPSAARSADGAAPSADGQRLHAELASAVAAHHDEIDQLHAELLATRAQLAKELSAHSADAQKLAALGSSAGAAAFGFFPKTRGGDDDLAIVEGIGPKIAELLRGDGIRTFEQLAATPVQRLHDLLAAAGPRFKIANHPETWPQQAGLCAKGQWEELRRLQEDLAARHRRSGGPKEA